MVYKVIANAVMLVHFAVLLFIVFGGLLAWRWPKAIVPHILLAGWGFSTVVFGFNCPLTWLENWGRARAGEQGLQTGFIDHYLEGVIYPERFTGLVQLVAIIIVVGSWLGAFVLWRQRRRSAISPSV